ncbi:MAG: glycosyltransferase [Acidaminococcaceae bacterium]
MRKKIKILHIAPGLLAGGVGKMIQQWYDHTNPNEYEYEIATLGGNGLFDNYLQAKGCKIYEIKPIREIGLFRYMKQFDYLFKKKRYDIVHSHVGIASFLVFAPAIMNGVKHRFIHAHVNRFDNDPQRGVNGFFFNIIKKLNVLLATNYCACTKEAGNYFFGKRIMNKNTANIILNGIDVEDFRFDNNKRKLLREKFGVANKFVICNIGRFTYPKNQNFLIDIFYHIQKTELNSILWLVGEGNDEEQLREKCRALGIEDKVLFLGVISDISSIAMCMDAFILPSMYEGLGIVAIEAQAAGVKCFVSTNVPREVKITNLVRFISLDRGEAYWANCILKEKEYNRVDTSEQIRKSGYDIVIGTSLLNERYRSAVENQQVKRK